MKKKKEIQELMLQYLNECEYYTRLYKNCKENKTYNKYMSITCYGSYIALAQILEDYTQMQRVYDIMNIVKEV